jgi:hypothetical protein
MSRYWSLLALTLLACAPRVEPGDSIPPPAGSLPQELTGTVRIVGSAPVNVQVVLRPPSGGDVRLTGPMRAELERLDGAEVAVRGTVRPSRDPLVTREVEVTGYGIVSVDGRPAVMGEVVAVEGGWVRLRADSGEEVYLAGAPSSFRVGQKVWVQGPRSVVVQSYGTIRP